MFFGSSGIFRGSGGDDAQQRRPCFAPRSPPSQPPSQPPPRSPPSQPPLAAPPCSPPSQPPWPGAGHEAEHTALMGLRTLRGDRACPRRAFRAPNPPHTDSGFMSRIGSRSRGCQPAGLVMFMQADGLTPAATTSAISNRDAYHPPLARIRGGRGEGRGPETRLPHEARKNPPTFVRTPGGQRPRPGFPRRPASACLACGQVPSLIPTGPPSASNAADQDPSATDAWPGHCARDRQARPRLLTPPPAGRGRHKINFIKLCDELTYISWHLGGSNGFGAIRMPLQPRHAAVQEICRKYQTKKNLLCKTIPY